MSQYLLDAFDPFTCLFTFLGAKVTRIVKRFIQLLTTLCAGSRILLDCCKSRPHHMLLKVHHLFLFDISLFRTRMTCKEDSMSLMADVCPTYFTNETMNHWLGLLYSVTFQNTGPLVATTEPGQFHMSYSVDLNVVLAVIYWMLRFNCLPRSLTLYYRPQTKFAKVMFLHESVILFTEGMVSQHALHVSRPTPKGEAEGSGWGAGGLQAHTQWGSWGRSSSPQPGGSWGVWLGGVSRTTPTGEVDGSGWGVSSPTPRGVQAHTQGGLQAHTQGGSPGPHPGSGVFSRMHWGRYPPPRADSYCCGWYASYWNAFLLYHIIT